jgi:hypothetical protein
MSFNNSPQGTAHIKTIADAAIARPEGVIVDFDTRDAAVRFRMQFNNLRAIERKFSKRMYKFDDPRYGTCAYDALETKLFENGNKTSLHIRTVSAALAKMTIRDGQTNEILPPEEL